MYRLYACCLYNRERMIVNKRIRLIIDQYLLQQLVKWYLDNSEGRGMLFTKDIFPFKHLFTLLGTFQYFIVTSAVTNFYFIIRTNTPNQNIYTVSKVNYVEFLDTDCDIYSLKYDQILRN